MDLDALGACLTIPACVVNQTTSGLIVGMLLFLVAAGLMLYVSGWLMVKQDPRGWQDYLAHKADNALAQDTVWAVAALAFLAVFREGAETVLFINALASAEGGWSAGLFAGLGAATAGLVVLFYFINLIAQKLPVTIELALLAMAIALVIGIPAGIVSAVGRGTAWDVAANAFDPGRTEWRDADVFVELRKLRDAARAFDE